MEFTAGEALKTGDLVHVGEDRLLYKSEKAGLTGGDLSMICGKPKIKYRIWSNKYKLFTHDPRWPSNQHTHEEYVLTPGGEVWTLVTTDFENYFRVLDSSEYVVQRATGLKDKNDKEIFEGDIVNHWWLSNADLKTGIVISHFGEYLVVAKDIFEEDEHANNISYTGNCWYQTKLKGLFESRPNEQAEIIGNIFENPNLLK